MPTVAEMFKRRRKGCAYGDVLTVDPGLGGTGLAFWLRLPQLPTEAVRPMASTVLRSRKRDWVDRTDDLADDFGAYCSGSSCENEFKAARLIVIESPRLWSGSAKSQAAAESNALFKLTILIGRFMEAAAMRLPSYAIVLVEPDQWKGQLPPRVVKKRIRERLGKTYREHEHAAVGIGLAIQGWLDA